MSERKAIYFGTINASSVGAETGNLVPTSVRHNLSVGGNNAGNVNGSDDVEKEVLELSESSRLAQEKHAQLLKRIEAERRARNISAPTSVDEVIAQLRRLGQPKTLFGEGPADRRERLREILARMQLESEETGITNQFLVELANSSNQLDSMSAESGAEPSSLPAGAVPGGAISTGGSVSAGNEVAVEDQLFYFPMKNNELKRARVDIFGFSMERTQARLAREKSEKTMSVEETAAVDRQAAELYVTAQQMISVASQNGDVRPISAVGFSSDAHHIATGSWSSLVKVWDAASCEEVKVFRGHDDRITGLAWHPQNGFGDMSDSSSSVVLCSGSADSTAKLWSASKEEPIATLTGHRARLGNVAFHPSGRFVGTTSFDHSWRLWDVEKASELLLQEGHYREVYAIAFQQDGALVATGDLNGIGRVWDLRSGKSILPLQGHSKQILSMDFATNGYLLASGSDDRTVRIWDLRQRRCSYVVPAHSNLVSEVKFSPATGELLLSASYDGSIKVWQTRDWTLMSTLRGHDGKVMSADFAPDEKHVVSCGFDRTFKMWAHESEF